MTHGNGVKIAPSILSADFWKLGVEITEVEQGGADLLHIDVMDGHFVSNITLGAQVIKAIKKMARIPLDVHLMIENPALHIPSFVEAGSDIITVHVETCKHLDGTLSAIKAMDVKVGAVLNPATPLTFLDHVLGQLDMVLLMSVNPGFAGQKFLPSVLPKIEELRKRIEKEGLSIDIEVDGGITLDNSPTVVNAGANVLVAGSAVFGSTDYGEAITRLKGNG